VLGCIAAHAGAPPAALATSTNGDKGPTFRSPFTDPVTDPVRERLAHALSGTHTIERELGGGGMARVFVATERALGRSVVVKTLPDDAWTVSAAQRFQREILTAAQLQHANIVPVLSAGDAGGVPFFTMPFVDGATLRARLAGGALPLAEATSILRDVARALAAAHAKGVVHRDIKPENILLSAGAALVTDFGVAKALSLATGAPDGTSAMTAVGMAIGTPAYMAPEQIAADPSLDHRADLYAWGLVAYETLCGQRPFAELTGTALVQAQMNTVPPSLRATAPQVPAALVDVVMQCLAKDPEQRPASATALLAVLDRPSGEASMRAPSAPRRGPLVAAAVLVAAAMVAAAWWLRGRPATTPDADVVAIAPFRVSGASGDVAYLREGIGDVVSAQLRTLPDLRVLGMKVMLDKWQRAAGSVDADLDDDAARTVAQQVGAGQLVVGSVIGTRDRVTIAARLLRAGGGAALATASVEGRADSVLTLGTQLVTKLFSARPGASGARLANVLSARPEALMPFLAAERAFRRGRYEDAQRAFVDAWRADTGFALAAMRISTTNGWNIFTPVPGDWLARAWAHRDRLSGEDSLVLVASVGRTYPRPMDRLERTRMLRELAEQAGSAELWYRYGDWLFHDGHTLEEPDVTRRALEAFRRAEALDSSYTEALEHQSMLYLQLGDSIAARRALARQAAVDSTGDFFRINALIDALALGGPTERARVLQKGLTGSTTYRAMAPLMLSVGMERALPPDLQAADTLLAPVLRERPSEIPVQVAARDIAWNSGRRARARLARAGADNLTGLAEEVLAGLVSDGDTSIAAESAARLMRLVGERPAQATDVGSLVSRFAVASWHLRSGDTASADRMRRELAGVTAPPERPWVANSARVFSSLLDAQFAVARRQGTAAALLRASDSLLLRAPSADRRSVRAIGNHVLAGLYEAHGDAAAALRVLGRRDVQTAFSLFVADRARRVARVARDLGRRDEEIEALRMFISQRARADADLQPEVERARQRLTELTRR